MDEINQIAEYYIQFNPIAACEALEKVSIDERISFLQQLKLNSITAFLPHLPNYLTISFLNSIEAEQCFRILDLLDSYLASSYLGRLEEERKRAVLELFSKKKQRVLETGLSFLPNTAGYYMDSSVPPVRNGSTVKQILEFVSRKARILQYIYVVDESEILMGVITLRKLIQELNSDTLIDDIMDTPVSTLFVDEERKGILGHPHWLKFPSLPVVNYNNRFLGVLRYETYALLRADPHDSGETELDVVGKSLSELYGIGFSALAGSISRILPQKE